MIFNSHWIGKSQRDFSGAKESLVTKVSTLEIIFKGTVYGQRSLEGKSYC